MQIYGPYRVSTAAPTANTGGVNRTAAAATPNKPSAAPVDQLDLSSSATIDRLGGAAPSEAIAGGGEIRTDRVADLRRQIASGNYDTPEKMDSALDRLLDAWG